MSSDKPADYPDTLEHMHHDPYLSKIITAEENHQYKQHNLHH
jgi:hypothetical protein